MERWLTIYQTKGGVWRGLLQHTMELSSEETEVLMALPQMISEWAAKPEQERRADLEQITPDQWKELSSEMATFMAEMNADVESSIAGTDDLSDAEGREMVAIPEVRFLVLVYLPCWFLYRKTPQELFTEACEGKVDSLSKLLRVDKAIISDPTIAAHIRRLQMEGRKRDLQTIARGLAEYPGGKVNRLRVKNAMVGLVAKMAKTIQHEITEPEIRELFDAVAAAERGELRDRDLPLLSESLYKTIHREEQKEWPGFPTRTKLN